MKKWKKFHIIVTGLLMILEEISISGYGCYDVRRIAHRLWRRKETS